VVTVTVNEHTEMKSYLQPLALFF